MFTKIIFTIIVVIAVWQGFKIFARLQDQREKRAKMDQKSSAQDSAQDTAGVEDMVQCSTCDAYVARGSKSCGKDGCPQKG